MITLYPYEKLGRAHHGWLEARHHFSFANYWDPARTGFGSLLVINDDEIAPQTGFGTHPHDNMEIITYVRQGAITHQDNLGNSGRTEAGDVQVMSAGTGVAHSEHNKEKIPTRLYQIWITPKVENVKPRWEARQFPKEIITGSSLPVLVSGSDEDVKKGALFIHQDAALYGGRLKAGVIMTQPLRHNAYILASEGQFSVNTIPMKKGDGAEVSGEKSISILTSSDSEILIIDVP